MKNKSRRAFSGRVLTAVVAALALSVFGAGIASSSAEPAKRGGGATVFMRAGKGGSLKFVGPETIRAGQSLRVVSKTSARVFGPHTFSLVNRSALPKTRPARRSCFAPGHICREIARWHGSNGNTPPTKNPAKAGAEGWDTSGSTSKNGDSWFTARRNASITQDVSLNVPGKPKRLFFLCAIHPFMQGSIKVLP